MLKTTERFKLYLWIGIAYLALWILISVLQYPGYAWEVVINEIWRLVFVVVLNFVLFEYTIPFIRLTWIRIIGGLFFIWIHLMMYSFGLYAWRSFGVFLRLYTPLNKYDTVEDGVEHHVGYSFASVLFFAVARHLYHYFKLRQATQQLKIEKQQAELNYLKSQTNPHFLFNTLNNIYSLSRDKSDLAPESIMRLSKILRFMLYETSGEFISIEQELKIINDYIALEKLRYDESLHVNFNYDIEDLKQAIPPLLLIPLIENAFKHGVSETRSRPFIDIHISVNQRQLALTVKNSTDENASSFPIKESIGLSNLRRQLELLYKEYRLDIHQGTSEFHATLKINLSSHV